MAHLALSLVVLTALWFVVIYGAQRGMWWGRAAVVVYALNVYADADDGSKHGGCDGDVNESIQSQTSDAADAVDNATLAVQIQTQEKVV
jgi:hypothetical protein